MPPIGSRLHLPAFPITVNQAGYLSPAPPRQFGQKAPYQSLVFPFQSSVVLDPQDPADPDIQILPILGLEVHLCARLQKRPHLLQAQLF